MERGASHVVAVMYVEVVVARCFLKEEDIRIRLRFAGNFLTPTGVKTEDLNVVTWMHAKTFFFRLALTPSFVSPNSPHHRIRPKLPPTYFVPTYLRSIQAI